MNQAYCDVGLVCLNGHAINSSSRKYPESNTAHCEDCGEPAIDACPSCEAHIRGKEYVPGVAMIGFGWTVPAYCHACGKPYSWTERKKAALLEAIDEVDELSDTERGGLKESVPDVLGNTPGTKTAIARFKKAIKKGGAVGGKLLSDVLTKVATEAVLQSMGLK